MAWAVEERRMTRTVGSDRGADSGRRRCRTSVGKADEA